MRSWILSLAIVTAAYAFAQSPTVSFGAEGEKSAAEAEHAGHGSVHHELVHGNAGSGLNDVSEFRTDLAIYTFVVFLVLLAILGKFAWPAIMKALEARERHILDQIASAEARHEDAKRLLAEHEAKLAAAAGEVREMLEEARRDADQARRKIESDGQKAAKEELDRALREIGRARDAALQELAISCANVAVDLARGVVRQEISAERQKQLVRDALGKLSAVVPSKN